MRLYGSFPRAWKHTVSMSANVHRTCGHCDRFADCTPVRLRVVPFSLSPSLRDVKEILRRDAWASRPLPGSSRLPIFVARFLSRNARQTFVHTRHYAQVNMPQYWNKLISKISVSCKCCVQTSIRVHRWKTGTTTSAFSKHTFLQQLKPAESKRKTWKQKFTITAETENERSMSWKWNNQSFFSQPLNELTFLNTTPLLRTAKTSSEARRTVLRSFCHTQSHARFYTRAWVKNRPERSESSAGVQKRMLFGFGLEFVVTLIQFLVNLNCRKRYFSQYRYLWFYR